MFFFGCRLRRVGFEPHRLRHRRLDLRRLRRIGGRITCNLSEKDFVSFSQRLTAQSKECAEPSTRRREQTTMQLPRKVVRKMDSRGRLSLQIVLYIYENLCYNKHIEQFPKTSGLSRTFRYNEGYHPKGARKWQT